MEFPKTPPADIEKYPAVTIGVPSLGLHKSSMSVSLASLAAHSLGCGIQINIFGHDLSGIAQNRNLMAEKAIEMGSTHILTIDSDMTFPGDLLVRLLLRAKDIVGVPYPRRAPPYELLGRPKDPENDQRGCVEFEMLPAGLLLVRTEVFKRIPKPWFWESYKYEGDPIIQFLDVLRDAFSAQMPTALLGEVGTFVQNSNWFSGLERQDVPLTQLRSEDINFGFKAQRYGYKLWGDLDLLREIGHIGEQIVRVGAPKENGQ
jgi:hypothetical protein